MAAQHRLPLLAFVVLSALCLLVAGVGLTGPAGPLPRIPRGSLLASGAPGHLGGETLQGRTSVLIPAPAQEPIIPPIAQGEAAEAPTGAGDPTAAVAQPGGRSRTTRTATHHLAQHRTGTRATPHRTTRHRPARTARRTAPSPQATAPAPSRAGHPDRHRPVTGGRHPGRGRSAHASPTGHPARHAAAPARGHARAARGHHGRPPRHAHGRR